MLPIGSQVVRKDFYVDDLLTGADSIDELDVIRTQVTKILKSAGFNLTKWFSNHYNRAPAAPILLLQYFFVIIMVKNQRFC